MSYLDKVKTSRDTVKEASAKKEEHKQIVDELKYQSTILLEIVTLLKGDNGIPKDSKK